MILFSFYNYSHLITYKMRGTTKLVLFLLLVATTHYVSVYIYMYYCAPSSIFGFLFSLVSMATPQCRLILYVQLYTSDTYYYFVISALYLGYTFVKNYFTAIPQQNN
jgi:hypothetical protein